MRRERALKRSKISISVLALLMLGFLLASCGGEEIEEASWERDPIVPGYSMAEINIGDPFSAAQSVHGDPDENRREGGYIYAYYGRSVEGGSIDDPGSWHLVVTLYDNGNGYLDADDEVGAIEVSAPYTGRTSGDIGLGSSRGELEEEFGEAESVSETVGPEGERLELYSYQERGVEFLLSGREGVITVIVTAYGGLLPVEESEESEEAEGGLFGDYGSAPIVPGQTAAGIVIGEEFASVKGKFGSPDSSGFTTEGFVYATYTGGYGPWKLNIYLEDRDQGDSLDDYDTVVSVSVRSPYAGKTAGGTGIGSLEAEVLAEFGPAENENTLRHQGEETKILEYNSRGIVFAVNVSNSQVVEIDVNLPL